MATPPNDDTKTLFQILADGEWHNYEEVRDAIAASVPPGRALRKYEERVEYKRKYTNDPSYDTDASEDDRIFYGARACGQVVITSWKGRGVDFTGTAGNKMIRKKPGFSTWGIEHAPNDPKEPEEAQGVPRVPPDGPEPSEPDAQLPEEPPDDAPESGLTPQQLADLENREGEFLKVVQDDEQWELEQPDWDAPTGGGLPAPTGDGLAPPSQSVRMEDLPHCGDCGLWIVDRAKHQSWHLAVSEPKGRDDMALFSESDVRRLVEEIVSKQLDAFQVGMQGYLTGQFSQLEGRIAALTYVPWRAADRQ